MDNLSENYHYSSSETNDSHSYLLPCVQDILKHEKINSPKRVFELGCGNGSVAAWLSRQGYEVIAVDPSEDGIRIARQNRPGIRFERASAYDPLSEQYGTFPLVLSLEVVEHVYWPRQYASCVYNLLQPGGVAIISTPFHGYLKNLALALSGKMDSHFTALWDGGHIKFWSEQTLKKLLLEAGFSSVTFRRAGRIRSLAKSMFAVARK